MFGQGFFQIDPNLTPEELQSRRERIQSMMPDGRARYVGEGLADLGAGIFAGVTGRKLNKIERENRQKAQDLFNGLMGGGSSGPVVGPLTVLGMPPGDITSGPIDDGQSVANDTMAALGREPMDATANIRSGLIKRGLPEHVADAFIMNMRDESGLKTDINEAAPIVPGSRGGYGLIQWTGPRRRQLEAFAAARGTAPSDLNTQLDFLMTELQGPEARAGQAILSTKTAPEAAAVILNDFLRPAEEHRARREAAYLGGAQPRVAASPSTTAQPLGTAQPGAVAQPAGGMDDLYSALQNPWLTAPQRAVVMQMIQQRQQASDPMRALQMEKAQLELEALRNPQPKPTDDMREYEFAKSQGYQGTFTDFMTDMRRAGATNITNTVGSGDVDGVPVDEEKLREKLGGAEGDLWASLLTQGNKASGSLADLQLLEEIATMAPQGPVTGRLAGAFPGVNSAADAFQSIVKRVAPTLRAEGSGSTSDIEYAGMLAALPQLAARPEANAAIIAMMRAKAHIDMERADIIAQYQNEEISAKEARNAIREINSRSIVTPELQGVLGALAPAPAEPAGDGLSDEDRKWLGGN